MKDRAKELIDKILRRSKVILDGLFRVAVSPNTDQLKNVEGRLIEYNRYAVQFAPCSYVPISPSHNCSLLEQILASLRTYTFKNLVDRIINRTSRLGDLERYDRLVNDFNTDFAACFLPTFGVCSSFRS